MGRAWRSSTGLPVGAGSASSPGKNALRFAAVLASGAPGAGEGGKGQNQEDGAGGAPGRKDFTHDMAGGRFAPNGSSARLLEAAAFALGDFGGRADVCTGGVKHAAMVGAVHGTARRKRDTRLVASRTHTSALLVRVASGRQGPPS